MTENKTILVHKKKQAGEMAVPLGSLAAMVVAWPRGKRTRGTHQDDYLRDFPGSPVVKNLPSNVGDAGSVPVQELRSRMT